MHKPSLLPKLKSAPSGLRFLTELVLVLNWKIYQWYQVDDTLGMTYDALWQKTDSYALKTLKGDNLHYYLSILD